MRHKYALGSLLCCAMLVACGDSLTFRGEVSKKPWVPATPNDDLDSSARAKQVFRFTSEPSAMVEAFFSTETNKGWYEYDVSHVPIQEKISFKQTERPHTKSSAQQNEGWQQANETTEVQDAGALDIAIVVDNSPSMEEEQEKLAEKLSALLSEIQNVDWRMAIITTDYREKPGDSSNPRPKTKWCEYLTPESPNLAKRFESAVRAGTGGWIVEPGFLRMEHLFKYQCDGAPKNWHRPNASLAVLFVSDEDNCSDGNECGGTDTQIPYRSPEQFLKLLRAQGKSPGKTARVYGLIADPNDPASNCGDAIGAPAHEYSKVIVETGGISGPICAPNYETVLQRMSRDFRELAHQQIQLDHAPIAGEPISIKINGLDILSNAFLVTGKFVNITSFLFNKGDKIEVNYRWGERLKKEFVLFEKEPQPNTIVVSANGIPVAANAWRYKPPLSIVFSDAPSPGTQIEATAVPAEAGDAKRAFKTELQNPKSLEVFVNGVAQHKSQWKLRADGTLEFSSPPADNAHIEITHTTGMRSKNSFPVLNDVVENSVEVANAATGEIVSNTFENGVATIAQDAAASLKRVKVSFLRAKTEPTTSFKLPSRPGSEKIAAWVDGKACGALVDVNTMAQLQCDVPPGAQVLMRYTEDNDIALRTFALGTRISAYKSWEWVVTVNGEPAKMETFNATGFVLAEQPPANARIELTLVPNKN